MEQLSFFSNFVGDIFKNCLSWFFDLFNSTGMVGFYVTAVGIFLVFSFLILPLRGAGVSDSVHKIMGTGRHGKKNYTGNASVKRK